MHYSLEARFKVVNSIIILLACKQVVHLGDTALSCKKSLPLSRTLSG